MKKHKKTTLTVSIAIFIIIVSLFYPSIRSTLNQTVNREFIVKVGKYAISANVKIIQFKHIDDENSSSTAVSAGASGVIIRKESNKYYVLTAEHVIAEMDNIDKTQIIVQGYDDPDYADSLSKEGKLQGIINYYRQFPQATVEYSNDKYDLAVISFFADEDYSILSVADIIPKYGDKIATMSNPYGKRNIVTAGKINSRVPKTFGNNAGKLQYPIITHTSVISEGSSGSALLNENLEIVGINLGGNENIFRQYISGMAIPGNLIHDFLDEWNINLSETIIYNSR